MSEVTRVSTILNELSMCMTLINEIEKNYYSENINKLSKEDVKHHLKLIHAYLDILEEDVENM